MPVIKRTILTAFMAEKITECLSVGMLWEEIFAETNSNEKTKLLYMAELKSELTNNHTRFEPVAMNLRAKKIMCINEMLDDIDGRIVTHAYGTRYMAKLDGYVMFGYQHKETPKRAVGKTPMEAVVSLVKSLKGKRICKPKHRMLYIVPASSAICGHCECCKDFLTKL